jgi:hypothetical protein
MPKSGQRCLINFHHGPTCKLASTPIANLVEFVLLHPVVCSLFFLDHFITQEMPMPLTARPERGRHGHATGQRRRPFLVAGLGPPLGLPSASDACMHLPKRRRFLIPPLRCRYAPWLCCHCRALWHVRRKCTAAIDAYPHPAPSSLHTLHHLKPHVRLAQPQERRFHLLG